MNRINTSTVGLLLSLSLFLYSSALFGQAAKASMPAPTAPSAAFHMAYNLSAADTIFELPKKLVEISGLCFSQDAASLYAIQDEDGIVFEIDKLTGRVLSETNFGKTGDYEGIERVGNQVFVVKSSGTIFQIMNLSDEEPEVIKHKNWLNKDFDVEGLGYDPQSNALLLACKGQPDVHTKEELIFTKSVYPFYLDSMQLDTLPIFVIDRQDILNYFQDHPLLIKRKKNGQQEERKPEFLPYYPSAIARHPLTGDYYIVSSRGKILFVLSSEGQLIYIEQLEKEIHPQPEGLVFDADGTLYISNEGKEGKGRISRYPYQMTKNQ